MVLLHRTEILLKYNLPSSQPQTSSIMKTVIKAAITVTKSLLAKPGFRHNGLKHNLPSSHNMATSHHLIWEKQRCYAEAAISNLHLIFISRAENNWMSHLLTQFHSANYSLVIFFSFPPLTTAF